MNKKKANDFFTPDQSLFERTISASERNRKPVVPHVQEKTLGDRKEERGITIDADMLNSITDYLHQFPDGISRKSAGTYKTESRSK